ncbi:hypothetical protein V8E53_012774 [Lactarius tabidus]
MHTSLNTFFGPCKWQARDTYRSIYLRRHEREIPRVAANAQGSHTAFAIAPEMTVSSDGYSSILLYRFQRERGCMRSTSQHDHGSGYEEFRADYELILGRSYSRNRGSHGARTRIVTVNHVNLVAWHGTSAKQLARPVTCTNSAEVLHWLLGALDSYEFVFERPIEP